MKKANLLLASCASLLMAGIAPLSAQTADEKISSGDARKEIALTIYNQNLALVREVRDLDLDKGVNHFALRDVSGMIKPETAIMTSKDDTKLYVLEQNFNFDLLSPDALTKKYVGKEITIVTRNEDGSERAEKAMLLANNGGLVLKYADRIEVGLPKDARIKFDSIPQNLRDRPTLVTDIMSEEAGKKEVNISYLSDGFGWKADYVAELNKDESKISLKGWVTLQNNSGTNYENAKLQLVAGDVNQIAPDEPEMAARLATLKVVAESPAPMQEEALLDYHLYTLPSPTTLNNNQIKQVALMSADNVPVEKRYLSQMLSNSSLERGSISTFANEGWPYKVGVYFNFINNKESHLGIPLPKGILRAYKPDSRGNALFIGEDSIKHTADQEKISLKFGDAFDVNVYAKSIERNKIGVSADKSPIYEYTNEITVKNAKDEAVVVEVPVYFSGEWKIFEENFPHEKVNSQSVVWKIKVDPKSDVKLTYKSREQY